MTESFVELRKLSEEELVRRHDQLAGSTSVGINHYLAELNWRHQDRQTESMLGLTHDISCMTRWIVVMTVVNVFAATVLLAVSVLQLLSW